MKLLLENWRQYQLLAEAKEIQELYESGQITEGQRLDRAKRFAKKNGITLMLALQLLGGVAGAGGVGVAMDHIGGVIDAEYADIEARNADRAEKETVVYPDVSSAEQVPLEDWYSESPPEGTDVKAKGNFVYIPYDQISGDIYLGENSPYGTAENFRKHVKNMTPENMKKQLYGKDSGGIFGGGTGYYVEYGKDPETGKDILPLEWSLTFEAFENATQRPDYKDSSSKSIFKFQ